MLIKFMEPNKTLPPRHDLAPVAVLAGGAAKSFKLAVAALLALLILTTNALALDRWTALAMVESNSNDHAVGRAGEISRYQIRPELWPGGSPLDAGIALTNAQRIMSVRLARFEQSHGRRPDDFEFYILWNAPAQTDHPHHIVAERARRYMNLVDSAAPAMPGVATR
jgi:hypothetical protein